MNSLFPDLRDDAPKGKTCRTCRFRIRETVSGWLFQYCQLYYNNPRHRSLRKIKASDPACSQYKQKLE